MKNISIITASLMTCMITSCSTGFTPEQKAQLSSSLAVAQPTIAQNAYKKPDGSQDRDFDPSSVSHAGNFKSGYAAGLIGSLVTESINATQRGLFNKRYANALKRAHTTLPTNITSTLRGQTEKEINTIPSFNGKIKSTSNNVLKTQITEYSYARIGKRNGKILMTPFLAGIVSLSSNGSQILKPTKIEASAYNRISDGHEISEYVNNKNLAHRSFEEAATTFASKVRILIESKTK